MVIAVRIERTANDITLSVHCIRSRLLEACRKKLTEIDEATGASFPDGSLFGHTQRCFAYLIPTSDGIRYGRGVALGVQINGACGGTRP